MRDVPGQGWARCCQELGFEEHGPRQHPHSKNPTGDRFVVPTLAKDERMGQPQVVVIHGAEAQGWASTLACEYKPGKSDSLESLVCRSVLLQFPPLFIFNEVPDSNLFRGDELLESHIVKKG